jgi:YHS domain-containing protein
MRPVRHLITTVVLVLGLAVVASAGEGDAKKTSETPKELKSQTHCPVMGGKIDSTVYADIQGQRVYMCCPMCSDTLKAAPDTFFKKAEAEGVLFENIQTVCPVSGAKLKDKSVYTDFEGRRVVFCCEKCIDAFNEDPKKYLTKLDESTDAAKKEKMKMDDDSHDHSGHNH